MVTKDEQLAALKASLSQASDALRVFPLQKNGLVSQGTRDSQAFKQALKSYSKAKANVLAFNKTQGE